MTDRQKPPFALPCFATFIAWRSPQWKVHTSEANARRALSWGRRGRVELWEHRDGEWHFIEERSGR